MNNHHLNEIFDEMFEDLRDIKRKVFFIKYK